MKSTTKQYAVVDKAEGKIVKLCDTSQEAWTTWQHCWMGKGGQGLNRYTHGQLKNMKKYLKKA